MRNAFYAIRGMRSETQRRSLLPVAGRSGAFERHADIRALADAQLLCGGTTIRGNLQKSHASQNAKDFAGCALRVRSFDLVDPALAHNNLELWRFRLKQHRDILRREVGDQVAEAIHFQYDSANRASIDRLGLGSVEADKVCNLVAKLLVLHA